MDGEQSRQVVIEVVPVPDARHVAALQRLLPQLSSAPPPDLDALRAIASTEGVDLVFARDGEDLLGTLTLVRVPLLTGTRAIIEDVVVDAAVARRGIGEALVRFALELARQAGARTVDLTSRPDREVANRLYARVGFERRETNVYRYRLP